MFPTCLVSSLLLSFSDECEFDRVRRRIHVNHLLHALFTPDRKSLEGNSLESKLPLELEYEVWFTLPPRSLVCFCLVTLGAQRTHRIYKSATLVPVMMKTATAVDLIQMVVFLTGPGPLSFHSRPISTLTKPGIQSDRPMYFRKDFKRCNLSLPLWVDEFLSPVCYNRLPHAGCAFYKSRLFNENYHPNSISIWYRSIALSCLSNRSNMAFRSLAIDGYSFHLKFDMNPWYGSWHYISEILISYYPLSKLCTSLLPLNRYRRCDFGHRFSLSRSEFHNPLSISILAPLHPRLAGLESYARRVVVPLGLVVFVLRRFQLMVLTSNDIMTTSPQSVGYRCLINQSPLYPWKIKYICVKISHGGQRSLLCCKLFALVGVWTVLSRSVNDIAILNSTFLVPTIAAWSSRGFLGSSMLCSSDWFEIYPCRGQSLSNVWMVLLLSSNLESNPPSCVILKLPPSIPNCSMSPNDRKLGSVNKTLGQTGCKLCVKLLNLHGHELHVREDSPALLRLGTQLLRSPVEALSTAKRSDLKVIKDVAPLIVPLILAIHTFSVTLVEHSFQSSIAFVARATHDHSLVKDFAKPAFMVESTLVQ